MSPVKTMHVVAAGIGTALISVVALGARSFLPHHQYVQFGAKAQYWFFPAFLFLFSLFILNLVWRRRLEATNFFLKSLTGLAISIALSTAINLSVPAFQWIQWDETQLMATSVGMHSQRSNGYAVQRLPADILPMVFTQDHRPPFFPFVVSVAHDVLGVQIENVFLVNSVTLILILFLLHLMVQSHFGLVPALSSQFLFVASPILVWCARSGGYDLFSLLFLGLMLFNVWKFLENPKVDSLLLCLGFGVLFSYTRYESILIFFLVGLVCFAALLRSKRLEPQFLLPVAVLPLLFLPLAAFTLRGTGGYSSFYKGLQVQYDIEPFGFSNFKINILTFLTHFFSLRSNSPFNGILNFVGMGACFGFLFFRRQKGKLFVSLCCAGVLLPLIQLLCWHLVDGQSAETLRLFLPVSIFFQLLPLLLLTFWKDKRANYFLLAVSVLGFLWNFSETQSGRTTRLTIGTVSAIQMEAFLKSGISIPKGSLFVTDVQQFFLAQGFDAVGTAYFQEHWSEIKAAKAQMKISSIFLVDIMPESVGAAPQILARNVGATEIYKDEFRGVPLQVYLMK